VLRGGVSEVIPVILLTVVGIAVALGVVGYVLGLWGHLGQRDTELLRLGVDSAVTWCTLSNGSKVRVLAVQYFNPGMRDTVVYRVEIVGYGGFDVRYSVDYWGPPEGCVNVSLVEVPPEGLVLKQGSRGWFYVVLPGWLAGRLRSGLYVDVRIYTRFGALFLQHVPVR